MILDPERQIHSISFSPDGVAIAYMDVPTDIRVNGAVVAQHQVQISASHPGYRTDILDLIEVARGLLSSALEDFDTTQPFLPEAEDDEDDERGMGE